MSTEARRAPIPPRPTSPPPPNPATRLPDEPPASDTGALPQADPDAASAPGAAGPEHGGATSMPTVPPRPAGPPPVPPQYAGPDAGSAAPAAPRPTDRDGGPGEAPAPAGA
ncbi:hypothetical protein ACFQVC_41235, partial [Streptomyces monticola]